MFSSTTSTMSRLVVLVAGVVIVHAQVVVPPRPTPTTRDRSSMRATLPQLAFTPFVVTQEYACVDDRTPRSDEVSMRYVYLGVNTFIGAISRPLPHERVFTDADLVDARSAARSIEHNEADVLEFETFYVMAIVSFVAVVVIFTLAYMLYACCRCCCSMRRRPKGAEQKQLRVDNKYDSCRRKCYTTLLALVVMAMVLACMGACLSNHYMHEGLVDAPHTLRQCGDDVRLYREETLQRVDKLLVADYSTLHATLLAALDTLGVVVVQRLKEMTGATAVDRLADLSETAGHLERVLTSLDTELSTLETQVTTLHANLTRLRDSATARLTACVDEADSSLRKAYCERARDAFAEYSHMPEQLAHIPEIEAMKGHLRRIEAYNVSALLDEAQRQFVNLETLVLEHVHDGKQQVNTLLERIGVDLASAASAIRARSSAMAPPIDTYQMVSKETVVDYLEVEKYRYIVGYLVMLPLGVITLLLVCGVCYGACGRRPSYYEDDCCVKSTGASVFCSALTCAVFFLLPSACIACALFAVGGHAQWLACDPMERPIERTDMLSLLDRYRQHPTITERLPPDVADIVRNANLTEMFEGCTDNSTLYTMLDIETHVPALARVADFKSLARDELDAQLRVVEAEVARMNTNLAGGWDSLLPAEVELIIARLGDDNVQLVPATTIGALRRQADALNILNGTHVLAAEMARRPVDDRDTVEVRYLLDQVAAIDHLTARPLRESIVRLADQLDALNAELPRLTGEIPEMLASLRHAQTRLAHNLTSLVTSAAHEVADALLGYVDDYAAHVAMQTGTQMTSCAKLARIADTSKRAVCEAIVDPLNAYWLGMLACIVLAMPAMILATCLRQLYRNTEAYTGIDFGLTHPAATATSSTGGVTPRHRRFGAFITDTYDQSYGRRTNKAQHSGYTQWRNGSGSSGVQIEEVTTPPPPYTSHYAATSSRRL